MKVLIVGGSGFLSGHMARHALNAGHEVWTISRGQRPLPAGVRGLTVDRHDHPAFTRAVAEAGASWDLVVDCIGFTADDARQDLADLAPRCGHLVFISTDMTCSPDHRPWRIDETFARFDTAPYGANKRAAEEVLLAAAGRVPCALTILRPGHIYGPGSQLGCLPLHGRDAQLIDRLRRRETLRLIGGGFFLQQPVFVRDLCTMAFSCLGNRKAAGELYFAAGPDVIESRVYYQHVADVLGVPLSVTEASITEYLAANPNNMGFCCHRAYAMDKAKAHGLAVPATPIAVGLRAHVEALLAAAPKA